MLASDRSASAPTSRCQTQHHQIQTWTAMGVRAHPHVAAADSSPPDPSVDSDGSASAPTHRCHRLITPQIQAWTATGVQAHPLIAATDSTLPDKRAQRWECERTHSSLPDSTLPEKRAQRRECDVKGAVPVSVRVCDFDPRKTCLAELGRARKESECRGLSG